MLFRISADNKRWHIDNLLANANVSLSDKDTSVVDGLCKVELENLGLQAALHEALSSQLEDIIKGVLLISHQTISLQSANERRSFEEALGVLGVKGEQSSSSLDLQYNMPIQLFHLKIDKSICLTFRTLESMY